MWWNDFVQRLWMFFSLCKWNIQYFSSPPQRTGGSQDIDPNDRVLPSGTPACCVSEKQKTGSLMFILLLFCSVCGVKSHQQEDRVSDWRTASCCCSAGLFILQILTNICSLSLTVWLIFLSSCEKTHKSGCAQITHTPRRFPSSVLISHSSFWSRFADCAPRWLPWQ